MTATTEIVLLSENEAVVRDFTASLKSAAQKEGIVGLTVDGPNLNQGALESWWDVAAAIGVTAVPINILCNLIASALWEARHNTHAQHKAKLVLRRGDHEAEIEITSADAKTIRDSVLSVVEHVYRG